MNFLVTTFYRFVGFGPDRLVQLQTRWLECGQNLGLRGLIILASEGCNATIAGPPRAVKTFRNELLQEPELTDLDFKDSRCQSLPFKRWKVEIRNQTIKYRADCPPPGGHHHHLTPEQWHAKLDDDVTVIDTRNDYEVKVGKFAGAIDPGLESFEQFTDYVRQLDLPKTRQVLLYCTGGIRCEKAVLDMEELGYTQVYQLEGGILKYLEQYPEGKFEGECFVFDERVAVDSQLAPSSTYRFCPLCGDPGRQSIECRQCGQQAVICGPCLSTRGPYCSKGCRLKVGAGE
ncbi:MAG: rhodanese-like domain-containing protein [Vulcanimicrobiota bacterium]